MGRVAAKIQDRAYFLTCGDGEEARLQELVEHVRSKADSLIAEHGRIRDDHLMLMSALLIADELWDQRAADRSERRENSACDLGAEKKSESGGGQAA